LFGLIDPEDGGWTFNGLHGFITQKTVFFNPELVLGLIAER
jgi:hypothetical protein